VIRGAGAVNKALFGATPHGVARRQA